MCGSDLADNWGIYSLPVLDAASFDLAIFDLDGTLVDFDRTRRLDHLERVTGHPRDSIHAAVWGSDFETLAEAGAYGSGDEYLREFNDRLGFELTRAQWIEARAAAIRVRPAMLDVVSAVREHVPVALLTNNGPLLHESLPELVPEIHELFGEHGYASCQFSARKPDPVVFTRLLERHGVAPGKAVFVDDDVEYIRGAQTVGLHTVHYQSAQQVRHALAATGLL